MKKTFTSLTAMLLFSTLNLFAQPTQTSEPVVGNVNNCTSVGPGGIPLNECPINANNFVSDFRNGAYNRGNATDHFGPGAIWRFANVGTIGATVVNAEITVNSLYNSVLESVMNGSGEGIEDDAAQDENSNSIGHFFAPRIRPDVGLRYSNRQGYVQFTITFFNGSNGDGYTATFPITNLNYVHYDIDGGFDQAGASNVAWFRETGVALQDASPAQKFVVTVANGTELKQYGYTDNGGTTDWSGFAGTVYERAGVSRCAQTAVSYRYTAGRSSVTFRMGYSFKAGSGGYDWGNPARQYGATFGCFQFPSAITLPVRLLDFSGSYKNNATALNWETVNEENFDYYEIQRSTNASDFVAIGTQASQSTNLSKQIYQYSDDLSIATGNAFYYRLKMIDKDGKFTYSNVIMIRKETKSINGITLNPVPVRNGIASVRFTSVGASSVNLKVVDMTGKTVLQQQSKVYGGNNSISLSNLDRLQPGVYVLQMENGGELNSVKFSIAR
jgi:hypothetical protein